MVELEIDGHPVTALKGSMIIQAADAAGIPMPRFCYHKKLPIAAVCRQCMVEVEMGGRRVPKPQVACATPVAQGMKVYTRSPFAIHAQQNALEFVLINHPLECPICDQGGECELQDLSLGYGRSLSRFVERKRTVADEDIGPLVATYMTRCIHCTRCVRFLSEIGGTYEFGDFNRADFHLIGTYIGSGVASELSGNIVDVCPVGALTDKVYEFRARPWEMIAKPSIGYHDALGSNLWLHTMRGTVLRAVPRDSEPINECWLSDRDRYSHQGLYARDRALRPLVRKAGALVAVEWGEAIDFVANGLRRAAPDVAALLAPLTSSEEGHLLAALVRGLGGTRIDHRLRVQDFSDGGPGGETFEMPVERLGSIRAALLVGSNPRHEIPLLNHRLREATRLDDGHIPPANRAVYDIATRHGAKIFAINPVRFDFNFELAGQIVVSPQRMVDVMLRFAKAAGVAAQDVPDRALAEAIGSAPEDAEASRWLAALHGAESSVVILGDVGVQHPHASWLRALARLVARAVGGAYDEFPSGANAIGLTRAGAQSNDPDDNAAAIQAHPPGALVTWQAECDDSTEPLGFLRTCERSGFHIHVGAFASDEMRETADAILPIGLSPEIDGTYVNVDGFVQGCAAGSQLPGEARPGWKVLRALGAALGIAGFDFVDVADVRMRISERLNQPAEGTRADMLAPRAEAANDNLLRVATVGIYRTDPVVRRAKALQAHPLNREAAVHLCAADARALRLLDGARVDISGSTMPVVIDAAVPEGCAWIEAGSTSARGLPPSGAPLAINTMMPG